MISERKLKKWRTDALVEKQVPEVSYANVVNMATRIDTLTRELMDMHLLKGKVLDTVLGRERKADIDNEEKTITFPNDPLNPEDI